ncbi:MAG: hypothetical protein A4E45_00982 [Methanosaeta sp. PtaB.Bin039]|nr:MAG: hypothetical protein A4E45_00982 [Methanosaeta sp. PtaB.Bin039]
MQNWQKSLSSCRVRMIAVLGVALVLALSSPMQAGSSVVRPGESIQSAIDKAQDGDTVLVDSGVYREHVVVDKRVTIKGNDTGAGVPVVDGGGRGSAITVSTGGVVLLGIGATNSGPLFGDAGIRVLSSGNRISGCTADDNGNCGILLAGGNNRVEGISARSNQHSGIFLNSSSSNLLADNLAEANRYGIFVVTSERNTIIRNQAVGNEVCGIFLMRSSNFNQLNDNLLLGNKDGLSLETSRGCSVVGNNVTANQRGIVLQNRNDTESIDAAQRKDESGRISIRYRPDEAVSTYNTSDENLPETTSNTLYLNRLVGNSENAWDDGSNRWNNETVGNHHSDYDEPAEGCRDRNRDGVCDSPLQISGGHSEDLWPLAPEDAVKPRFGVTGSDGSRLRMEQGTYLPAGRVEVTTRLSSNFSGWIGIVPASLPHSDQKPEQVMLFSILDQNSSRKVGLQAPEAQGSYELRLYRSSGEELAALPFQVEVPSLSAAVSKVEACGSFNASYFGAPGYEGDWIGVFAAGAEDQSPIYRRYLDGSSNGTVELYAPTYAGQFDLRLFQDNGYTRLASSQTFQTTAAGGVRMVAEPARPKPGQAVTVHFWGATPSSVIGMYGTTRPDKNWINMQSTDGRPCGTLVFKVPGRGNYDFRLFENMAYRKHMGVSNTVIVE